MILYIKNIPLEGPETLGEFFSVRGFGAQTVELQNREPLPDALNGIKAVVVLGGPMNVNDESEYPFLKPEKAFIRRVVEARIPYLGLCLGSQLLAVACGASVGKSPQREIGFSRVALTPDGKNDPLFAGLGPELTVYQWHEDTFALPSGALMLGSSEGCPHQAFRLGPNAYGLQFHLEITDRNIREWSDAYLKDPAQRETMKERMVEDYASREAAFRRDAEKIYQNFLGIIENS